LAGIAARDRRDVAAGGLYPAGVLVPEDARERHAGRLHQAFHRVEVGRADTGAADANEHVTRLRGLGYRYVDELERPVVLAQDGRPHARYPL
jgi:hypothetical protein